MHNYLKSSSDMDNKGILACRKIFKVPVHIQPHSDHSLMVSSLNSEPA